MIAHVLVNITDKRLQALSPALFGNCWGSVFILR
jgi:hypothetical protein